MSVLTRFVHGRERVHEFADFFSYNNRRNLSISLGCAAQMGNWKLNFWCTREFSQKSHSCPWFYHCLYEVCSVVFLLNRLCRMLLRITYANHKRASKKIKLQRFSCAGDRSKEPPRCAYTMVWARRRSETFGPDVGQVYRYIFSLFNIKVGESLKQFVSLAMQ